MGSFCRNNRMVSNGQTFYFVLDSISSTFAAYLLIKYLKNMKKFIVIAFLMIVMVSLYGVRSTEFKANTLLLDNVEAIAADEGVKPMRCFGSATVYCPITQKYVEFVAEGYSLEDFD